MKNTVEGRTQAFSSSKVLASAIDSGMWHRKETVASRRREVKYLQHQYCLRPDPLLVNVTNPPTPSHIPLHSVTPLKPDIADRTRKFYSNWVSSIYATFTVLCQVRIHDRSSLGFLPSVCLCVCVCRVSVCACVWCVSMCVCAVCQYVWCLCVSVCGMSVCVCGVWVCACAVCLCVCSASVCVWCLSVWCVSVCGVWVCVVCQYVSMCGVSECVCGVSVCVVSMCVCGVSECVWCVSMYVCGVWVCVWCVSVCVCVLQVLTSPTPVAESNKPHLLIAVSTLYSDSAALYSSLDTARWGFDGQPYSLVTAHSIKRFLSGI